MAATSMAMSSCLTKHIRQKTAVLQNTTIVRISIICIPNCSIIECYFLRKTPHVFALQKCTPLFKWTSKDNLFEFWRRSQGFILQIVHQTPPTSRYCMVIVLIVYTLSLFMKNILLNWSTNQNLLNAF